MPHLQSMENCAGFETRLWTVDQPDSATPASPHLRITATNPNQTNLKLELGMLVLGPCSSSCTLRSGTQSPRRRQEEYSPTEGRAAGTLCFWVCSRNCGCMRSSTIHANGHGCMQYQGIAGKELSTTFKLNEGYPSSVAIAWGG